MTKPRLGRPPFPSPDRIDTDGGVLRTCRVCQRSRPIDAFPFRVRGGGVRRYECRACTLVKNTQWRDANKDRVQSQSRARELKKKYGITAEQFAAMLASQRGVCAICLGNPRGGRTSSSTLCVDHDAQTGRVRGLLCAPCNQGIGLLRHGVQNLERAVKYLADSEES